MSFASYPKTTPTTMPQLPAFRYTAHIALVNVNEATNTNKVYHIFVVQAAIPRVNVVTAWGRRGKALTWQRYTDTLDDRAADRLVGAIERQKASEGYRRVDPATLGDVPGFLRARRVGTTVADEVVVAVAAANAANEDARVAALDQASALLVADMPTTTSTVRRPRLPRPPSVPSVPSVPSAPPPAAPTARHGMRRAREW